MEVLDNYSGRGVYLKSGGIFSIQITATKY